ncbi:Rof transcriptional antiterminator [Sinobacterium caligoides]|uniref:Rof transcriptional antiterminator n=1 Tax=Sinobacterium caligoides TaxID=933926 RepID=A0A3N2DKD0_9GAMM|nr:Rho-binding antiterminator [Sinobacterium caligoides]ROS00263.1 Rof transcriptional antiterminator [Sinobacterium caligoides]
MISCDLHDYIEIACLYRYEVKIVLKSKVEWVGTAVTVEYDDDKRECLRLAVDAAECLVVLDTIERMQACQSNPHFDEVVF